MKLCTAAATTTKATARPSPLLLSIALLLSGAGAGANVCEGDSGGKVAGGDFRGREILSFFGILMSRVWPAAQWPGMPQMK